jgi:hypothetical protein
MTYGMYPRSYNTILVIYEMSEPGGFDDQQDFKSIVVGSQLHCEHDINRSGIRSYGDSGKLVQRRRRIKYEIHIR